MPISGTSKNYAGRTKDIHIFQGVNPNKASSITPQFGKISNYCAGIQKLIQRYAITLLTNLGSQENYLDFGSNLIQKLIQYGSRADRLTFIQLFNFANAKVITEFREHQRTVDMPEDEQLDTAVLKDFKVVNTDIHLTIQIFPVSKDPVQFIIPVPYNI